MDNQYYSESDLHESVSKALWGEAGPITAAREGVTSHVTSELMRSAATESYNRVVGRRIVIRDGDIYLVERVLPQLVGAVVASAISGSAAAIAGTSLAITISLLFQFARRGTRLSQRQAQLVYLLPPSCEQALAPLEMLESLNEKFPESEWSEEEVAEQLEGLKSVAFRDGGEMPLARVYQGRWYRADD